MLLKPSVVVLNTAYTAGCERAFLKDLASLEKQRQLVRGYTTAKAVSQTGVPLSQISYPHFLLNLVGVLTLSRLPFLPKVARRVLKYLTLLSDLLLSLRFYALTRTSDVLYVSDVPCVALFAAERTVLSLQNDNEDVELLRLFPETLKKIRLVFPSKNFRKQMVNKYPFLQACRIYVIYNSVDKTMFPYKKKLLPKTLNFLFVGTWAYEKGVDLLAETITSINESFGNKVSFTICGSADLWSHLPYYYKIKEELEKKVLSLQKFDNVRIVGKVRYDRLYKQYQSATFCIFPSVWEEPFANVVIESLSCGTPIIAFARGGTMDVLRNGNNGYEIKTVSSFALTQCLKTVIKKYNYRDYLRLSENARITTLTLGEEYRAAALQKVFKDCPDF